MRKILLAFLLVILLLSAAASIFRIELAKSSQIWLVDDDGPADFATIQGAINSPLVAEGDTIYVQNGFYREHVVLNRSISLVGQNPLATIIDGNASEYFFPALTVFNVANTIVKNFTVQNTTASSEAYGMLVYRSRNLTMQNVIATNAFYGVLINNSTQCRILDNTVRDNYNSGIVFRGNSSHNIIVGNLISDNPTGIYIESYSEYNVFYRNNIVSNTEHQFNLFPPTHTSWDNGAEGNYWSDYMGIDVDGDGVGDTDLLPHLGVDSYPLIELWNKTRTYTVNSHDVVVSCNYTVASFAFNETLNQTSFYVTGPAGWSGFCNITIPKELLNPKSPSEKWIVILGTNAIAHMNETVDDSTLISFTYILGSSMQANRVRIRTGVLYPPTASFDFAPEPASTIEPVNFTDTSTNSPNGTIVRRQWDFGDGYIAYNETFVSHRFNIKTFFSVTLTVGDNNSLTDSVILRVWVRNLSPSADFSFSPTNPSVGSDVDLDASESRDPDGRIVEYNWDFGDSTWESTGSLLAHHRFEHVGTYNVTLTAVDEDGAEDKKTQIISVGKGATRISIYAPANVRVGENLTIEAALLYEDGRPLAGKQVKIEVYDSDLGFSKNVNTDDMGVGTTALSLNSTGEYVIRASYIGSIDYQACQNTSALAANLVATSLELQAPENTTQNRETTLSATLLDEDGNPMFNTTVEFHIHNGSAWELLGAFQTNQSGTASFIHKPVHAGDFALKATYNGDEKHAASTSGEHSFTVAASETYYIPYLVLAAIMASAIIILLVVLHRKKRQEQPE